MYSPEYFYINRKCICKKKIAHVALSINFDHTTNIHHSVYGWETNISVVLTFQQDCSELRTWWQRNQNKLMASQSAYWLGTSSGILNELTDSRLWRKDWWWWCYCSELNMALQINIHRHNQLALLLDLQVALCFPDVYEENVLKHFWML